MSSVEMTNKLVELEKELAELQQTFTGSSSILINAKSGSFSLSHNANQGSQFYIGSISKQMTAVILLKALSKKEPDPEKLASLLNDKLVNLFPDSPLLNAIDREWVTELTLLDLLTHRSGLPTFSRVYEMDLKTPGVLMEPVDPIEILRVVTFDPFRSYQYSDTNYYLLGKLLEEIEGKSYADIFDDMIKTPLQLSDSHAPVNGTYHALKFDDNYSGLTEDLNTWFFMDMSNAVGCGNIVSTVEDLLKWNKYLFNDLDEGLKKIVFDTYCLDEDDDAVHLGLTSSETSSGKWYGFQGTQDSFKGCLGYLAEYDMHISILTNNIGECDMLVSKLVQALMVSSEPETSLKL